jgi:hypothetical protein
MRDELKASTQLFSGKMIAYSAGKCNARTMERGW